MKLFFYICKWILALRYTVTLEWMENLKRSSCNYLILPNHPGLIDPQLVFAHLGSQVHISPVMTETYYNIPVLKYLFKATKAISVPDLTLDSTKINGIEEVYQKITQWLQSGKNIILYPAGQIYSQWYEKIVGKKTAFHIVKNLPENTRVIAVRTTGVWGSIFTKAYSGKWPKLIYNLWLWIYFLLANFLVFVPKRKVSMTLVDITDVCIIDGKICTSDINVFNQKLEDFYNQNGKEEALFTKHYFYFDDGKMKKLPEKITGSYEEDERIHWTQEDISQEVFETIKAKICLMKENIKNIVLENKIINDLFFDSLDSAELKNYITHSYPQASNPPLSSLKTVYDFCEMALWKSKEKETLKDCFWVNPKKEASLSHILHQDIWKKTLLTLIRRNLKKDINASLIYDSVFWLQTKKDITLKSFIVAEFLKKVPGEYVSIMLPSLSSTSILITSCYLAGKVPVMLNWTVGKSSFNHCVTFTKSQKILTSRTFYEKIDTSIFSDHLSSFIFLEDLLKDIGLFTKLKALLFSKLFFIPKVTNPYAVILFTSGSEWLPKAVALTHTNIIEVLKGTMALIPYVTNKSILLSYLPPFHSFGFTVNTLLPLLTWVRSVMYPNPNDAKNIVELIEHTKTNFITSTPTFLHLILKNALNQELKDIQYCVVGAEKCSPHIFDTFHDLCPKWVLLEGYGITECSPVISLNPQEKQKLGSVGKAIEWLDIQVLSLKDNTKNPANTEWMIFVTGPSVFDGYIDTDLESPFIKLDGKNYYKTGDLGYIDEEGYIYITWRLKRFIKIAGEMISLPSIENALSETYGSSIAIEAKEKDGSAKIVLFTTFDHSITLNEANALLRKKWVSNLVKFSQVQQLIVLPVLGTGKIDYKELKKLIEI